MITVNDRTYNLPQGPVVGICMDGTSFDYYEAAKDLMPNLQRFIREGSMGMVHSVVPSFTNPNNMAMVTGAPPSVNGICGNYYYDKALDAEVMMNDPRYLRAPSILASLSQQGKRIAVVTVKDKLRAMLAHGLAGGVCFSAEFADRVTTELNGIENVEGTLMGRPQPGIYDPGISVYCIEAGARLLAREPFDLMYLTTTDFVQHKYAPGHPEANAFLAAIDQWLGELDRLGAIVGVTADHGMNDKTQADGSPNVRYAESILADHGIPSRVILPITDPYVVHHGALGSYGTVYLAEDEVTRAREILSEVPGFEKVLSRDEAAAAFHLPPDRIGELVILSDRSTVIGRTAAWHDLSVVAEGLRSHGGLHEAVVPMIFNRPLAPAYAERLATGTSRNYDLFDYLLNGIA
ncbi:MAG: phosphonoacetate hydrolase [Bacteroidia bacterium]|nr:phosphonoacetate hydrolase [Bacteroidia bacterium]